MPTVHVQRSDGSTQVLQVPLGSSIMRAAVDAGVSGIIGECGGAAMCGTCHVFIDPAWADRLPPPSLNEDDLLEGTAVERRPTSRLSCQLRMTEALDGLRLSLPDFQR